MSDPSPLLLPAPPTAPVDLRLRRAGDRARASLQRLQAGLRDELAERFGWRAVVRARPWTCLGLALAAGFLIGARR